MTTRQTSSPLISATAILFRRPATRLWGVRGNLRVAGTWKKSAISDKKKLNRTVGNQWNLGPSRQLAAFFRFFQQIAPSTGKTQDGSSHHQKNTRGTGGIFVSLVKQRVGVQIASFFQDGSGKMSTRKIQAEHRPSHFCSK